MSAKDDIRPVYLPRTLTTDDYVYFRVRFPRVSVGESQMVRMQLIRYLELKIRRTGNRCSAEIQHSAIYFRTTSLRPVALVRV